MAVNFNKPACIKSTNEKIFGICDDTPPPAKPAYLDFSDSDDWIAWVDNDKSKNVQFTAIDNCIDIRKANGIDQESRCDGMLNYDRTIIFVELKDRHSQGWLSDAIGQLKTIIGIYKVDVGLTAFDRYFAYVSNKQRPYVPVSNMALSEQFEDDTDFVLVVDQVIKID